MVSQTANPLRGTRARIHVWIPSVSVLFVVALCLCTLVASMHDEGLGRLSDAKIGEYVRRLYGLTSYKPSKPTSPASLQAQQAYTAGAAAITCRVGGHEREKRPRKVSEKGVQISSSARPKHPQDRTATATAHAGSSLFFAARSVSNRSSHAEWEGTGERTDRSTVPSPPRCRPTGRLSFPRVSSCRPNHRQREKVIRKPPRLFPPRCRPTSPYFLPMPPHAVAQLQQQRMQVLRCQEFEPSFFAERQGLEVQTDRPRSKLIHKQIDRQPSTAFARTILAPATPSAAQTNAPGALACLPASASSTPLYAHT